MRTAAVKPVFHSLLITYLHLLAVAALLLELLTMLDELFELKEELTTELLTPDDLELELAGMLLITLDARLLLFTLEATLLLELAPTIP
jgi:hypothetical protein